MHFVVELSTLQFGALQFSGVPRRSVYRLDILNILAASCANIMYFHSIVFLGRVALIKDLGIYLI